MTHNTKRIVVAAALLAGGAALLSGCTAISDLVNREATSHYADTSEMAAAGEAPDWVPDDAIDITLRTPADADSGIAVVLLTSEAGLPDSCAEAPRSSAPVLAVDGAPDVYKARTVTACGDWSVIPTGGGWYGWTPNTGDVADRP